MRTINCVISSLAIFIFGQLSLLCSCATTPSLNPKMVNKETGCKGKEHVLVPSVEEFRKINFSKILNKREKVEDNYNVDHGSCIGSGFDGTVMRASERKNEKAKVAVKKVVKNPKRYFDKPVRRAKNEACILTYCKDEPYIIKLQGVFEVPGGGLYMVLELAPGGDLSPYSFYTSGVRREFKINFLSHFLRDVLAAFQFLHRRHMVHGDVKPANILICRDRFKLCDFGCCSGPESFSRTFPTHYINLLGAPPEAHQRKGFNEKADIWALGVVALSLVFDVPESKNTDNRDLFYVQMEVCRGLWENDCINQLSSDVREKMSNMLMQMLEPNPNDRASADNLLEHPYLEVRLSDDEVKQYFEELETNRIQSE